MCVTVIVRGNCAVLLNLLNLFITRLDLFSVCFGVLELFGGGFGGCSGVVLGLFWWLFWGCFRFVKHSIIAR